MHRTGVADEVCASPTVPSEELVWLKVSLEPIARGTRHDEVARIVRATSRERYDVIQRGRRLVEMHGTVDASLATVAQGDLPHRALHRDVHDAARTGD